MSPLPAYLADVDPGEAGPLAERLEGLAGDLATMALTATADIRTHALDDESEAFSEALGRFDALQKVHRHVMGIVTGLNARQRQEVAA